MQLMTKPKELDFLELRLDLDFDTQDALALEAGVDQSSVSRAERGQGILRKTALKLLRAFNRRRKARGEPPLRLGDIGWKIND